jgi:Tim10/DDP family zinc finger
MSLILVEHSCCFFLLLLIQFLIQPRRRWKCTRIYSTKCKFCLCCVTICHWQVHSGFANNILLFLFFCSRYITRASSCFNKCASRRHKEPDLSLGEMTCTDRCVSKYLEGQQLVGAVLQKANEDQMKQQQAMQQMQQSFGN